MPHAQHIAAIAEVMAQADVPVWLHIITDGRDTLPKAAGDELPAFLAGLPETRRIASVTGRYFAMDRDNRWDRTQAFCDVMVTANALIRPQMRWMRCTRRMSAARQMSL